MMDIFETMKALCRLPGVSGWEGPVREEILSRLRGKCECRVDALGNILAFKKGKTAPKNKVLFSAHMDEVGFIITYIEDSGLLRFAGVGGIDSRVVLGKAVEVGEKGLYGVIGSKAVHLQEEKERSEPGKLDKLYIDIGAESREEALEQVQPGDRAVFCADYGSLGDKLIFGRALDDRAGCALLLEMIERELPYDCHFSFTVQEETGCTGGITAGYAVAPDIAVAVETTTASDIAGVDPDKVVCSLGKGPVVSFMDKGTVYDPQLYRLALDTARDRGIPCQTKQGVFGGNESRSLQTARGGARAMAVSVPCRYLHSPAGVVSSEDITHAGELLAALAEVLADL